MCKLSVVKQKENKKQTFIMALTQRELQIFETNWVVINGEDTHALRKPVNIPILITIDRTSQLVLGIHAY